MVSTESPTAAEKEETRLGFAQTKLPWIAGAGVLLIFLVTLNHWVNLRSLPVVAKVTGWDWAAPVQWPLFFTLTYPFRWLPDSWQVVALNIFTATCGALALALLARSVALLPHDRTHDQRVRERSEFSLLSIPGAWLPPLFAVLVCGLQLTFWEHATAITVEMLDLLVFAYCIRCLLEYRISHEQRWLLKLAFVYGLGVTNNWAMIGFFPLFAVATIWIMGVSFFRLGFILRALGAGLAGLSLYLLLPIIWVTTQQTEFTFWEVLKANFYGQKNFLIDASVLRNRALILSLVSVLPILVMGIRWPSSFGDTSAAGATLTVLMFRVIHLFFLAACLWVAFDPKFSPRELGYGIPFLTFYYLGALAVGYFSGYALLVFTDLPKKSYRRQSDFAKMLNPVIRGAVWLAFIAIPIGLIYQNFPVVRAANGPLLRDYVQTVVEAFPDEPAYILSDDPSRILLVEGYFRSAGIDHEHVLVNTRSLENPSYHRELEEHYGARWPGVGDLEDYGARVDHPVLQALVTSLAEEHPVLYLNPSFGYFFEKVYALPQGPVYPLERFESDQILPPAVTVQQAEANQNFWATQAEFMERVEQAARREVPEAAYIGASYARVVNNWGVEMQKLEKLTDAEAHFRRAAQLDTNNSAAILNLRFNESLQAGGTNTVPTEVINEELAQYRTIDRLLATGIIDDPRVRIWLGNLLMSQSLFRQAVEQLTRAVHFQPTNFPARLMLSKALIYGNWPDAALAQTEAIRKDFPGLTLTNKLELLSVEAAAHFANEDVDTAENLLLAAVKENPGHMAVTKSLFDFYRLGQRWTNALAVVDQALAANPTNAAWLLQKAETHLSMGNLEAADESLDKVLEIAPGHAPTLLYKAFIPMQQGQYEAALEYVNQVLRKDPENSQAMLYRGNIHLELENYDDARKDLDAVLEKHPRQTTALRNRALLNLRVERYDDARKDYEALRNIAPRSHAVYWGLGEIAYKEKDYKDAVKFYERYLKYAPESTQGQLRQEREQIAARVQELKSRAN